MGNDNDLNDSLDDMLGGQWTGKPREARKPPADFVPVEERWKEGCTACGGSGRWRGRGICFKCKGEGFKAFKTSPESRAKARDRNADKAAKREADKAQWRADHKAELTWILETAQKQRDRVARGQAPWAFPESLAAAVVEYGTLTDGQLAAVQKFMARDAERAAERQAQAKDLPTVDASALEAAFDRARTRAQRPGATHIDIKPLALRSSDNVDLTFWPATPGSKWAGMIFVKAGERKIGFVKEGKFFRRNDCSDQEAGAVLDCVGEPARAAIAWGKAWRCCSVCARRLDNDESIARGIGPICAERFGF